MKDLIIKLLLRLLDAKTVVSLLFRALDQLVLRTSNDLDDKAVGKLKELADDIAKELEEQIRKRTSGTE